MRKGPEIHSKECRIVCRPEKDLIWFALTQTLQDSIPVYRRENLMFTRALGISVKDFRATFNM